MNKEASRDLINLILLVLISLSFGMSAGILFKVSPFLCLIPIIGFIAFIISYYPINGVKGG